MEAILKRAYRTGATPFWVCQADPRFSYCLYVPEGARPSRPLPLIVVVHGSYRVPEAYRDRFAKFAEDNGCVVLCPLFPCGIVEPEDTESYKFVYSDHVPAYGGRGVRYDQVLLSMVSEASERFGCDGRRFHLAGYSGGGQFANRFFYGHPDRLLSVSIGAPGNVTLLDPSKGWFVGIGGMEAFLGKAPDLAAMRQVAVHMVVGEQDLDPSEVVSRPGSPHNIPGINDTGSDRVTRLRALEANLRGAGLNVRFDLVPEVAHNGFAVLPAVFEFLAPLLAQHAHPTAGAFA
ncbi:alpha/beta hydrolase [Microvirga sp. ACRRW]|uniref:PHB depolymerase family esterase n=1 Tax=Microvirga sp. ACRRW TaxID=2918205 RepID=UPI001EF5991C|nr:PHB depolymerase family esterase [Microvirga sp. ACRRW]MCG7393388.1 alpha/beta hydrolase [Microvirga sp. ACRRW]